MDVVERYPWSGEEVLHGRRDKRRGQHRGVVLRSEEGHPVISVSWDDPYGGECTDEFILSPDGTRLTQETDMRMRESGQRVTYK